MNLQEIKAALEEARYEINAVMDSTTSEHRAIEALYRVVTALVSEEERKNQ